ncbi:MAG TPA: tyrosine recombinase XerC [Planctomycetes bacterium]|nr:tyrosine recombinase XerC [Planctomycetota bacterium]HIN79494.1 tyrosine recombinase XerC [Planctomycetota bacterium]
MEKFLAHLEGERNLSPETIRAYRNDLVQLATFFSTEDLSDLADIDIYEVRRYLAHLATRGYSKSTIARKLASIRGFFRFIQREENSVRSAFLEVRTPKVEKSLPHFLTAAEVVRLIECPDVETFRGARDRCIIEVLYSCGVRVSELVAINWGNIDENTGVLRAFGKGRRERVVPIGSFALEALAKYRERIPAKWRPLGPDDPVVLNRFGKRISDRSIRKILDRYIYRAGLDGKTSPHTLRHSFATHMLDGGANLREVQELLGHKHLATTQIYTHLSTERLQRTYRDSHPHARLPSHSRQPLVSRRPSPSTNVVR